MRRSALLASGAIFSAALGYSWLTHGTGIVRSDPERHISVPAALTMPLRVQVAHNGTDVLFRYRWPAPNAGIFHDMLRFEDGAWRVRGAAVPGSQPDGLHEDRVAMMLDDGSVPEFGRYGGYVAIGNRRRWRTANPWQWNTRSQHQHGCRHQTYAHPPLPQHDQTPAGRRRCQSVACWKACATCSMRASSK